jgi:hypothetical protein
MAFQALRDGEVMLDLLNRGFIDRAFLNWGEVGFMDGDADIDVIRFDHQEAFLAIQTHPLTVSFLTIQFLKASTVPIPLRPEHEILLTLSTRILLFLTML